MRVTMLNATVNFVLGLSVGLVLAFIAVTHMTEYGSMPLKSPRRVPVEEKRQEIQYESGLTHEDLGKIKPIQLQDTHAHYGHGKYQ